MTIDEAIAHCLEVAEQNDAQAEKIGRQFIGSAMDKRATDCRECAADHRQLAEWLTDYKELKNSIGAVKLELLKEAQAELEKRGNMLHDAIAELEETKRLLKLAVKDFETIESNLEYDEHCVIKTHSIRCDECPLSATTMSAATIYRCKWRHADEALKLIES